MTVGEKLQCCLPVQRGGGGVGIARGGEGLIEEPHDVGASTHSREGTDLEEGSHGVVGMELRHRLASSSSRSCSPRACWAAVSSIQ